MERVEYDELSLLHENAAEFGVAYDSPAIVRRERVEIASNRAVSALVWGTGSPELVLLHGGAARLGQRISETVRRFSDRAAAAVTLRLGSCDGAGRVVLEVRGRVSQGSCGWVVIPGDAWPDLLGCQAVEHGS